MIQIGTKLRVSDNSGARYATCIKILSGSKRKYAKIGDKLVVSITMLRAKRRAQSRVQKGKIAYGVLIRSKIVNRSVKNIYAAYSENAMVLITQQGKPIGSRVIGSVPRQLRYTKYMRIATLASGILK